ncbi:DUF6153 family protein [Glutamicibacter sp. JL.03c]|uniref:DUF6153 family protein n=1 Tax=Glutamicibacter sp. JL.03c TaxID=2984842 RepID=UPI0021F7AC9A|nr:DUF6153 family protein [Glutamicibacter sp. JL.03c]UYQ78788.1 DUF6153 family protein [Glutamicibacter sp. JL.03c]
MGSKGNAMQPGQRPVPALAWLHLALLVGAVFMGLLSMHVLVAPAMPSAAPMSSSGQGMIAHSSAHDSDMAPAGGDEGHGCSDCPMDHEMSAAGCVLALLALLLLLRPPGILALAKKMAMRPEVLTLCRPRFPLSRPDLTALGICRT